MIFINQPAKLQTFLGYDLAQNGATIARLMILFEILRHESENAENAWMAFEMDTLDSPWIKCSDRRDFREES